MKEFTYLKKECCFYELKKIIMIKLRKLLLLAGVLPFLLACNKEHPDSKNAKPNTYVGISLQFPTMVSQRALPDDYNKTGNWKGRDEIESIDVYLVNTGKGTVNKDSFHKDQFNEITSDGQLMPNLAVEATAGDNVQAYVVVNAHNTVKTLLDAATASDFATKFSDVVSLIASDVATMKGTKEKVMMANIEAPQSVNIKPNVTKAEAIAGQNRMDVKVERVVSRGIVSMKNNQEFDLEVKDATGLKVLSTVKVKSVKYKVGQSNRKFYLMKKADWQTPDPVYSYIPSTSTPQSNGYVNFDYSDELSVIETSTDNKQEDIIKVAEKETKSKFVLPVTHEDNNYKKGNTTYFEIVAEFYPTEIDGEVNTEVKTVFLGMSDGKFYSSRAKAESMNPKEEKANGWDKKQQATQYKNGKMKYILWLNPDKPYGKTGDEKMTKSPTVRNQIYHAYISGFKEIGVPNNPLNPNDPDDPKDPDNPDNPIDPNDPLQNDKTYMSVSIQVLPWTLHSYSVDLSNDIY